MRPRVTIREHDAAAGTVSRGRLFGFRGFTVLELMIVITIILGLLSVAIPNYQTSILRSKEAVLRDHLFTMRSLIDQYTLDKQKAPESLGDLVSEGYLRDIPIDPITRSRSTWTTESEDSSVLSPDQTAPGIADVHSGSSLRSLEGTSYSTW